MIANKNKLLISLISFGLSVILLCGLLGSCDEIVVAGEPGPAGMNGEKGEQGAPGEKGEKGDDGETPFIGDNGNWFIGDTDTGIKATGNDGEKGEKGDKGDDGAAGQNGNTPYVGENGNWFIGDTDTGIKAAGKDGEKGDPGEDGKDGKDGKDGEEGEDGEDGEDGITPSIGSNGNWYIGDTDTGVKAEGTDGEDGKTPYIGINGNWWINNEDTGVSASGNGSSNSGNASDDSDSEKIKELLNLKQELRVNEDGSFRVVVFSDIHFYGAGELSTSDTLKYINNIVDKEEPDLVLFAGDNWWGLNSAESFRSYVAVLVEHIEEKQIPWAHVYGNHDDEINYGGYYRSIHQSEQQKICEEFEYCVSKWGDETLSGVGNYVLPVLSYDGTKIAFNIWGLDSGSYAYTFDQGNVTDSFELNGETVKNTFYGKYEGIRENQVEWYVETSKLLEEYNGEKIPAMMYFHIPLQETYTAWKLASLYGKNGYKNQKYGDMEVIGTKGEGVCAPTTNAGLFDKVIERGDVKLITYGHDHVSDFSVVYRGVNLCYVPTISTRSGVGGAGNDLMGGRVIDFSVATGEMTTRMSYVKEPVTVDPNAPILDLVIGDDGTVSNADNAVGNLTYHEYENATVVTQDTTINKNVINFTGHATYPSVYNIPAASYNSTFADGFSYEIMFKLTECNVGNNDYVGILDYVQAGGWGLTVKNVNGTLKILQETKVGSAYNNLTADFEVGKWYHVVYVFTGDSAALYVNGVKADSATGLSGNFAPPALESRSGEEYICVGGCSHAWQDNKKSNGIKGMTGSVAICNVRPNILTEAEALALYDNVKNIMPE